MQGNCFERDVAFPYSALTDLLRNNLSVFESDSTPPVLSELRPELVKLVPELEARRPDLDAAQPPDAEQERRRIFHALSQLFVLLARERPLLVVLEDLHWADETTLYFIVYCCRQLSSSKSCSRSNCCSPTVPRTSGRRCATCSLSWTGFASPRSYLSSA